MLMDLITADEKALIDRRRRYCADQGDFVTWCSIENLLTPWEDAKSAFLSDLFGDKLILKKPISIKAPTSVIEISMEKHFLSHFPTSSYSKVLSEISRALDTLLQENRISKDCHRAIIGSLYSSEQLAKNKFEVNLPSYSYQLHPILSNRFHIILDPETNKQTTITNGMKLMKVFHKVAEAVGGIPDLDQFIVEHSQILNTSKIEGNFCLSIHPLDYITMSDNDCDWSSCMSWGENGEYRQGTVEMMNSKYIVVGYVESNRPMQIDGYLWNSKKYRSLFFVNDTLITNIKGYPYISKELNKIAVDWLKELVEKTYHIEYGELEDFTCNTPIHYVDLETNLMYNDCQFGSPYAKPGDHIGYVNKYYTLNDICKNYSGPSECMVCGETYCIGEDDPSLLSCSTCADIQYCDCCDCAYPYSEFIEIRNRLLCPSCAEYSVVEDCVTGEDEYEEDCVLVGLKNPDKLFFYNQKYFHPENEDKFYETIFPKIIKKEAIDKYNKSSRNEIIFDENDLTTDGLKFFRVI